MRDSAQMHKVRNQEQKVSDYLLHQSMSKFSKFAEN